MKAIELIEQEAQMILAMIFTCGFKIIHEGEEVRAIYDGSKWSVLKFVLGNVEHPTITVPLTECTIQARPIESLAVEEQSAYNKHYSTWQGNLYLISIGTLPPSAFEILTKAGINIEWVE